MNAKPLGLPVFWSVKILIFFTGPTNENISWSCSSVVLKVTFPTKTSCFSVMAEDHSRKWTVCAETARLVTRRGPFCLLVCESIISRNVFATLMRNFQTQPTVPLYSTRHYQLLSIVDVKTSRCTVPGFKWEKSPKSGLFGGFWAWNLRFGHQNDVKSRVGAAICKRHMTILFFS